MLKEKGQREALGEDVRRVVLGRDAEEDEGKAEDCPPHHRIASGHPARPRSHTVALLHGARVREQRGGDELLRTACHVLEEGAQP